IPSNMNTAKKLKSLIFNVVINRDYPEQEAERVNGIINTVSKMSNCVSPGTISKSEISLISVASLNPIWAYQIENVVKARFRGSQDPTNNCVDFIRFLGKTFDYFEDTERQLVEIP